MPNVLGVKHPGGSRRGHLAPHAKFQHNASSLFSVSPLHAKAGGNLSGSFQSAGLGRTLKFENFSEGFQCTNDNSPS